MTLAKLRNNRPAPTRRITATATCVVTNAPLTSEGANISGVEGNTTGNVVAWRHRLAAQSITDQWK